MIEGEKAKEAEKAEEAEEARKVKGLVNEVIFFFNGKNGFI